MKTPTRPRSKVIPVRSDKHVGVIKAALPKADVEDVDGARWLVIPTTEAQAHVDGLATYAAGPVGMYDARLATGTLIGIRQAFPTVTDSTSTGYIITGLNDRVKDGTIKSWSVSIRTDGNLDLEVVKPNGKTITGTRREIQKELGIARPAAEVERNSSGLTASEQARADKVATMKTERAAVKAWETAGGDLSGKPKPATPVTDKANSDLASKDQKRTERAATAAAELATRAAAKRGKTPEQARPRPKTGTPRPRRTRSTPSLGSSTVVS